MSDQKLISPLLDGFTLGNPMSNRSGVRCYPAIKENTDKKYIVKVISIPASQVQLDALLLTGAYKDPGEAMDYFKAQTDAIVEEAEMLQKLARLEGFLPYEGWQVEPMENGLVITENDRRCAYHLGHGIFRAKLTANKTHRPIGIACHRSKYQPVA